MSEYLDNLVKCFNNSDLGVNLTLVLIDNRPWFIAKEVATILGYERTKEAINRNVNPDDQKILSYEECKVIFDDNLETIENSESFSGADESAPEKAFKINSQGVKIINE